MTDFYLDQLRDVKNDDAPNLSLSPATVALCQAALIPAEARGNWSQDLSELDDDEWTEAEEFLFGAIDELSGVIGDWNLYVDSTNGGTWHLERVGRNLRIVADNTAAGDRVFLRKRVNLSLVGDHWLAWDWVSSGPLFSAQFRLLDGNEGTLYSRGTASTTNNDIDEAIGVSGQVARFIQFRVTVDEQATNEYMKLDFLNIYQP